MPLHRVPAALLLVLALTGRVSGQDILDQYFGKQQKDLDQVRRNEDKAQRKNVDDWCKAQEKMEPFWLMVEGQLLQAENKFPEAKKKLEKAKLDLVKLRTPASAFAYRDALLQLAAVHVVMGNEKEARQQADLAWNTHLKAVDPMQEKDLSEELQTTLVLAFVYLGSDRPGDAVEFVRRTEAISEEIVNRTKAMSKRIDARPLLGEVFFLRSVFANTTGSYQRALEAGKEAEALFRKQFPPDTHSTGDPKLAAVLVNVAMAYVALENSQQAMPLLHEAEHILNAHAPKGKPLLAELYRIRGQLLLQRAEVGAALKCIDDSRKMYEELFPPLSEHYPRSHPTLIQALTTLADLLNQYNQTAKAGPGRKVFRMRPSLDSVRG